MASDVLFDIDASEILAKLHLAAKQQANVKKPNFIVNTGIIDDNDSATPEKPGKVRFDLKNSTNEYQVGYVTEIEYKRTFDIRNKLNDIEKEQAKIASSKIDTKDSETHETQDQIDASIEYLANALNKNKDDISKGLQDGNYEEWKDKIVKEITAQEETESKDYNEKVKELMNDAIERLNVYMENFAGKENITKITDANIGMMFVSRDVKDANDKALVDMFEIQKISDTENEKLQSEFRTNYINDPKSNNCKTKVCFNIAYTLNVDK